MQDKTKDALVSEMTTLRNCLVSLGNMSEIKITMPAEDVTLAGRWESLLDQIYDEVLEFAEQNGIPTPELR